MPIYFLQHTGNGLIKIGYSRHVPKRIQEHRERLEECGEPPDQLSLIGVFRGNLRDEQGIHRRLRGSKTTGYAPFSNESYRPTEEVVSLIASLPAWEHIDLAEPFPVANMLDAAIRSRGLTSAAVGRILRVSTQSVEAYRDGRSVPRQARASLIERLFNVPQSAWLTEEQVRTSNSAFDRFQAFKQV